MEAVQGLRSLIGPLARLHLASPRLQASLPARITLAQARLLCPRMNVGGSEKVFAPRFPKQAVPVRAAGQVAESEPVVKEASAASSAVLHYHRKDGAYEGWGLHTWEGSTVNTPWNEPLPPTGSDEFGVFWEVALAEGKEKCNFLVHRGEEKDCGGSVSAAEVWLVALRPTIFSDLPDLHSLPQGNLSLSRAFWVSAHTLAVPPGSGGESYSLVASRTAGLELSGSGVQGGDVELSLQLDPSGLSDAVKAKFPHIAHFTALSLPADADVADLVKCQLALATKDGGSPSDATGVQLPGVLDDLFAYDGPLGPTLSPTSVSLHLWAPTAQSVHLLLFTGPSGGGSPQERIPMAEDKGVWSASGPASWHGKYYLYEVTVFHPSTGKVETGLAVDPYARGLSANGERSLVVDLQSAEVKPEGWEDMEKRKPALERLNDISILEVHIRDFSILDETVEASKRGGYLAFAEEDSNGAHYLRGLAAAGLTHVHLLPAFDFSSVNEKKENWKEPDFVHLSTLPPDSEEQQAAVVAVQDEDGFNWGYDPVNYGVPDGSYASNPDGATRTLEFRTMVQSLNRLGLRVVLDVVYNHTHGSGHADPQSVLDKVVPGYYLRRNLEGGVENSTCMNNTASEHAMMERLVVDDLVHWAVNYKVDGFRFDLMGHLMLSTMEKARDALRALTLEKDGVDGSRIYIYGEGWSFGEIANNARGVNASQLNLAGTGIGSFNDRIRDTAMGGSPFGDPQQQGFLTGLALQPNDLDQGSAEHQAEALAATTDWIKIGLVGNLRDYEFTDHKGNRVSGGSVKTHDGVSVGYTATPTEVVNYVSAHDNETLFDVIMLKTSTSLSLSDRCRINAVATSLIALQQGVAFFHAGDDMLRSKSLDRDSYNSGDWFNRLDFTYKSNNFGVGLPPKGKNGEKWDIMRPLLADPALKPSPEDIQSSLANLRELLAIRYSSPLFRLTSAQDVQERVEFLACGAEALPGVIIMSITDDGAEGKAQLDPKYSRVVIVFNARPDTPFISLPALQGAKLELHPVQVCGHDDVVKCAEFGEGGLCVPGRTTAVFVERR